eukprot:s3127_g1.t1
MHRKAEKLALENLVAEWKDDGIRTGLETYEVRAGNQLMGMFRPGFWPGLLLPLQACHGRAGLLNTWCKRQEEVDLISDS